MLNKVKVYHDGKACRDVPAVIVGRRKGKLLIEFTVEEYDPTIDDYKEVTEPRWFIRRRLDNGGVYECQGWNYWYYANG